MIILILQIAFCILFGVPLFLGALAMSAIIGIWGWSILMDIIYYWKGY
jgi:hypothetical protein